jgi:hypothetical protein
MTPIRWRVVGLLVCCLGVLACSGKAPDADKPPAPGGATATSAPTSAAADPFAAPSDLKATLADPSNIDIRWKNNATAPGGAFLEFNMNPGEEYTLLEALMPSTTQVRHPDVAPETRFGYRIRPFFGQPSAPVEIMTRHAAANAKLPVQAEGPVPDEPAGKADSLPKKSLKSPATIAEAAPADVTVALASPTAVDIRWKDRASDEEGYLVELTDDPQHEFRVVALMPPDSTSFRKVNLPPDTRCYFRARAYFSGPVSNVATVTTPPATPEPPKADAAQKP